MRGFSAYVLFIIQILIFSSDVQSQQIPQNNVSQFTTEQVYQQMTIGTRNLIQSELAQQARFCITDPEDDWNRAFDYSGNLSFVANCMATTGGDLPQRICTAAELRFYFANFVSSTRGSLQQNINCNTSAFVSGCEPGWACSTGSTDAVDYESPEIPARTSSCGPCCEGFFCPERLTCMIPCPLGSYCPIATLNGNTSSCDPYTYQLPAGRNHTCGGANIWADVGSSSSMFCSAGSYCPTNTQEIACADGHFCRMGSTRQRRCMPFTSCDARESSQNITQYGIMLIVAISFLLFIFYTCYGQAISLREKRDARSREYAVRTAKENAQARAHWQTAKDGIKKIAIELQSQASRSFSRINYDHQDDTLIEIEEVHTGKEKKDSKKRKTKAVHINKDAQNIKYAYSQLEKEKAQQNQDFTFSEAIKMTVDNEARRRPPIVIAFKNLTVTLKHKKKDILKSVTGEVNPGRITALMGPSGAGKTTLLSALTGKTVGCVITGSIFINGKADPIRSYKKIVGFVPQDDVVHGNLTVQENIWFSANCRLPADLSKAHKVLIVERVIDSLGLQPVRDSLVGTVEKRGISGGQRKRVNVGLELVMEPSLLFLDEPTSGLDSSSSQLLLRALRREAREGVNICMVVHQPSYSLFQMFDDLILLAKGGHTVYHGPVGEVEDYFSHLGINVPERINPPDYFIDVLEGMIKLNTSLGLSVEELPLRWMLHKGYPVPTDMQKNVSGHEIQIVTSDQELNTGPVPVQPSFWLEFMQNFKYKFEGRLDVIRNNFTSSRDLSGRKTPSMFVQYRHFLGRLAKQRLREARTQAIDFLILLLAGACLGLIARSSDQTFGAPGYTYTIIAVSLLSKIAALRTFSLDKLNYQRERASGISSFAHFIAKDTIDHFNTIIKPLVYLSMFFFFSNLRSTFQANYIVLLCLVYCVTGIAYVLAMFLQPGPSQLCSVLLPVVLTLLSTQPQDRQFMRNLTSLCYPRWALEAFIVSNARSYSGVWLIQRCGALLRTGYNLHDWNRCIALLMAVGAGCRILAFYGMLILKKK